MEEGEFNNKLGLFKNNPSVNAMNELVGKLLIGFETAVEKSQKDLVTIMAKRTIYAINTLGGDHSSFRKSENLLEIYNNLSKLSFMGAPKFFDTLESIGDFCDSKKFYLYLAEAHAQKGNVDRFREIMEVATSRITPSSVIPEFRVIARTYLPGVRGLFNDLLDDTAEIFCLPRDDARHVGPQANVDHLRDTFIATFLNGPNDDGRLDQVALPPFASTPIGNQNPASREYFSMDISPIVQPNQYSTRELPERSAEPMRSSTTIEDDESLQVQPTQVPEEENSVTRCICQMRHDSYRMIQCDSCESWQHAECYGISIRDFNLIKNQKMSYSCVGCDYRNLPHTKEKAQKQQEKFLKARDGMKP